ncbi:MAG: AraC family transcriptional regulator [Planctomycetes bacterium]|nr:AraC family transcriptional regulator [Planctomycetota bacterium]
MTRGPSRRLDIRVASPWPGLPLVGRLAWERIGHRIAVEPFGWKDKVAVAQVVLRGAGWVEMDGQRQSLIAGQILLFNSCEHRLSFGSDPDLHPHWEICWADLTGEPARAAIRSLVRHRGQVVEGGAALAAAISRHLPDHGVRQVAWSAARSAQVAWEVLAALAGEGEEVDDDGLVARAGAWFDAHLALPSGVAAAAAALGCSREHFTRSFRDQAGMSPGAWLRRRRIERAEEMLAAGTPVAEVARRVGFASRSHFAAAFRKRRGRAPSSRS